MRYYLVGIKGTGMSALALYLKSAGHSVNGSDDENDYYTIDKLNEAKIDVLEYNKDNITSDYIYIIGLSINKNNVEFKEILDKDLEYHYYNDFIAEFIDKKLIAVSGTHGKTTTCHILSQLTDISYIIGCGNGLYKNGDYLALEACEYKNHFLSYSPEVLLVLNMDYDHPDFFKNKKAVINSFQEMCNRSQIVIINGDDKSSKFIKHQNIITYGFNRENQYTIRIVRKFKEGYVFLLKSPSLCRVLKCNLPGLHNLYNYVGAYLACLISELPIEHYKNICLPERRLTSYSYGKSILIDDYAHHPNEIKALYFQLKDIYPNYKLNVIFQSHTYSRTLKFKKNFRKVLSKFNKVYMLDVFSSIRESSSIVLQKKLDRYFKKFEKFSDKTLEKIDSSKTEVWVFLGAGNATAYLKTFKNSHSCVMKI